MTTIRFKMSSAAAISACLAVIMFASCKKDPKILDLNGTVAISPAANALTGDVLTASYNGSETVTITWQWNKDAAAIANATSDKYTPTEAGSYTVTASAKGFNSKTSATAVEVRLAIFLLEERQTNHWRFVYEYDDQDRLTKISWYSNNGQLHYVGTFRYNAADGHMEEVKWEFIQSQSNRNDTWTKNSNKVKRTYENGGYEEYELNPQGFPLKHTSNDASLYTRNFTWENGNITQDVWVEGSNTYINIYTYDDKKSPFYHSKTPKWVLDFYVGGYEEGVSLVSNNNIKTFTWDGGTPSTYEYEYNADGFPTSQKCGTYTETYTYKKR